MEQTIQLFGMNFMEVEGLLQLLFRFLLNSVFAFILIERIYFKINKQREYLFTFFIFNILIFFVSSLLSDVKMKTGFAFGLFAIFSILRYRTEQINIKEMTFLFTSIILAVSNSTVTIKAPLINIIFADIVIVTAVYLLERNWIKNENYRIQIQFDDISLINRNKSEELKAELGNRTGYTVTDFEIMSIDYLRDTALITVYYE